MHNMHYTHNTHNMHNTPTHKQFYQYDNPLRERFISTAPHCVSGLIRFIARTVGRRR